MIFQCVAVLFLLLNAATVVFPSTTNRLQDLNPQDARVLFETDGGRLEIWGGEGSGVFEATNVAPCRIILKNRGLWLPTYMDAPSLYVVTRGAGRVGVVTPYTDRHVEENTFKVIEGDVVALRRGHAVWWYNDENEDLEIVGVASTENSQLVARPRAFELAGARYGEQIDGRKSTYGAVVYGFSKEVLARAWGMDKETLLHKVLEGQTEHGIVRVDEDIIFREDNTQEQRNMFFQNFIYRLSKAHPDLRVENGGEVREVDSHKLPVLKHLGVSLECMQLEQDAMVAPNWFLNAHQVLYVVRGRGRIQAVDNNGERVLDTDLEEGSLVVIPSLFPSTKIAPRDEHFHYISFVTSDRPQVSFMSGRKSVYRGLPLEVFSPMMNIHKDQARQIQHAHEKESIIFPSGYKIRP